MKKNNVLVAGLALFSMFFGAGNLIFPPTLGRWFGSNFIVATIGFLLTAVGIVMTGIVTTTKAGGTIEDVGAKTGKTFSIIFATLILLAIGPGLAIPRTAATTFEMVQGSILPSLNPILSSIIFFVLVLYFALNPTSMIDRLGKILTPALILMLAIIIIKGIISPIGPLVATDMPNVFGRSFEEGYQTMDALATLMFTAIIIQGFEMKGIKDRQTLIDMTIKSAIFAAIALSIVYAGLLYIGSTTASQDLGDIDRVALLIYIADSLLGTAGKVFMSIAMALACLTTAIGLTSTVGNFFHRLSGNKIDARIFMVISTLFSAYFAVRGVESIITLSVPILLVLYPVSIVLIVLNLFPSIFQARATHIGAVFGALLPTIGKILSNLGLNLTFVDSIKEAIPAMFGSFLWIIPVIICGILFTLAGNFMPSKA